MRKDYFGNVRLPLVKIRIGVMMLDGLSKREQDVLSCLREGLSDNEIALMLGISPRAVQKHVERVFSHLGVETRAEVIVALHHLGQNQSGITWFRR